MNWKRAKQATMLGVVGGALATVLTRVASVAPLPTIPSAPAPGVAAQAALVAEIDRLHDRLRAPVTPVRSRRNPFTFDGRPLRGERPSRASETSPMPPMATPPPVPPFQLLGLAEDSGPNGLVRTAIIAGPDGLHHARPGDIVAAGYRVLAVHPAAVLLSTDVGPSPLLLELK